MASKEKLFTMLILLPRVDAINESRKRGLTPLGVIREMPANETMLLLTGDLSRAFDWVDEEMSYVAWLVEGDYLLPAGNA